MVLNLFEKRKARVITAVGTTDPYEASDGIDQGEVLSPLLWRIFYDPLLCYMADKEDIGYEIKVEETTDWARQSHKQQKIKFSVLAYADDTTWIAANQTMLKKITEIACEFFEINNIQINGKKSKLLILNPSV